MKRVVVTGIGAVTPIGNTLREYTDALKQGVSGAATITHFDPVHFKTRFACEVKNFDPTLGGLDRKEARKMDLFCQYAMVATAEAYANAGLNEAQLDLDRCGIIWGSGIGGLKSLETENIAYGLDPEHPRFNPFMIVKMIIDIVSGHLSIKYNFQGINYGCVSACASSGNAIMNAADQIRLGRQDVVITGGSEAAITYSGVGGFGSMKAMSTRNDDPATASRPFDQDRDGFVLGEGGAALILEEYEHAKKRGATILAEVVGYGATADAHHITAPHPDGVGAAKAMKNALLEAKMNPEAIDYVNVHGTSTPLGDIAELKGILSVFNDHSFKMNISSTKSMTGHLLGAAGAIEAVAGILAMHEGFVPPTINHFTTDPNIDSRFNLTINEAQNRKIDVFLNNTFGFGGHNVSLIFKRL